jgi:hypothetical protein
MGDSNHQPTPQVGYVMAAPHGAMPAGHQGYPYMYPVAGQPMQVQPMPVAMNGQPFFPMAGQTPGAPTIVQAIPMQQISMAKSVNDVQEVKTIKERLLERDYAPELAKWLNGGWNLYKVNYNWLKLLVWAFVCIIFSLIPLGGGIFLVVPLHVGLTVAVFNAIRTTSTNPNVLVVRDFIPNIKLALLCLVATLFQALMVLLGFICLIVPGIYLSFALGFGLPLYIEYRELGLSMFDAFSVSNKQTWKRFWHLVVFQVVLSSLASIGVLAFLVGVLVTFPIALLAHCFAVREIFGLRDTYEYEMGISGKL